VDYDGENLRKMTSYGSITLFPRWNPDGKRLAFTSYKNGNPDSTFDLEKGAARTLSDARGSTCGRVLPTAPAWRPRSPREEPNVFILTLADGSLKRVTSHFGVDSSPTFSPDGEQVAFVSDRAGNPQIHVQELATGRVKRLTRMNWCDSPSWSPSGEWIAFSGGQQQGPMDIFIVDVTGTRLVQLTHGKAPTRSRPGRRTAASSPSRARAPSASRYS